VTNFIKQNTQQKKGKEGTKKEDPSPTQKSKTQSGSLRGKGTSKTCEHLTQMGTFTYSFCRLTLFCKVITKTTLHSMRKLATKKTNTLNLMKLQTLSFLLTKSDENLPEPIFQEKAALPPNNKESVA
jgi:hypothetical protein